MKNILSKIVTTFVIIAVVAIGLKVSDNILADANALSVVQNSGYCGTNNGWIWNGTTCVNTCDQNHPWDPYLQRCSGGTSYTPVYGGSWNTNCAASYGSNFYFNGKNCVQSNITQNANYYGNPYNGGTQNPVYGTINYNNLAYQSNNYIHTNNNYYYPNTNNGVVYYNDYNLGNGYISTNPCQRNCYTESTGPKKTEYYIYTITTTTSQPKGTPIYLGNYNNYIGGTNYYGNNGNTSYYYENYSYGSYGNGYYDIYGMYHY